MIGIPSGCRVASIGVDVTQRRQESLSHRIRKRLQSLLLTRTHGAEITVVFFGEGDAEVKLPRTKSWNRLANNGLEVWRKQQFANRPSHEILLRRIVHRLYMRDVLSREKSIVDIGSWLGDNSIVWAKMLEAPAVVYAIDPSDENIQFAKSVADFNHVTNILWQEAVCSDTSGQPVGFKGNLDHASFFVTDSQESFLRTDSLDNLVGNCSIRSIGLMHIDVEGFELAVLRGAAEILLKSQPIVLFEGHLRDNSSISEVAEFVAKFDYKIFMVNEVLPGCNLDCRNFLSTPTHLAPKVLAAVEGLLSTVDCGYPAVIGPALLPLRASSVL